MKATDSEDQSHGAGDMKREINIVLLSDEGELSEEFPCLYSKKKRSRTKRSHNLVKVQQNYDSDDSDEDKQSHLLTILHQNYDSDDSVKDQHYEPHKLH